MTIKQQKAITYKWKSNFLPVIRPNNFKGPMKWKEAKELLEKALKKKPLADMNIIKCYLHKSSLTRLKEEKTTICFVMCPLDMPYEEVVKRDNEDSGAIVNDRISDVSCLLTEDEIQLLRTLIPTRFDKIVVKNVFKS